MQLRLSKAPEMMRVRNGRLSYPSGRSNNGWGATHFLTRKLAGMSAEMSFKMKVLSA
jgi:hypothetical protein